jgi:hypothetical protein
VGTVALIRNSEPSYDLARMKLNVNLDPPDWRPTSSEAESLRAVEDRRRKLPRSEVEPLAKRLMEAFHRFNRISLVPGARKRSRTFQDAHADYKQRAQDFLLHRGREAYLSQGQGAIDGLVEAIRSEDKPAIERLAGRLYREARASHLISREGVLGADHELILRLAAMEWWILILAHSHVVDGWLEPLERDVLRRWKLAAQSLSPQRRMEIVQQLRVLDSPYPAEWAMAAHAAEARDWPGAAAFYERALEKDPSNETLQASLKYARERVQRNMAKR